MSDEDDYEYEYDSDASDEPMMDGSNDGENNSDDEGSFEYTDEEPEADGIDVVLENAYYNAKGLRDSDMSEAAEAFGKVVTMEHDALLAEKNDNDGGGELMMFGPWSFKALKQVVKVRLRTGELDLARDSYRRLLNGISSPHCDGVSPNAIEKGIHAMLERVSSLFQGNQNLSKSAEDSTVVATTNDLARHVYDGTLTLFHPHTGSCPNERLWCKTNLKYGQLLYEMNETPKLQLVIRDLLKTMHQDDGNSNNPSNNNNNTSSSSSSTNLMEIYALQIQLHSRQKDNKKLRQIFAKAMRVQGGIPHPRTLALIQELGGKMHMASREFEAAGKTFFQAFKSYDEAGDVARLRCLKYLVMASMLHASSINPFDSQEVRPYRDDPEIKAITNLVEAFQGNEIERFEGILARNEGRVMDDEFIREHIGDLKRTIRRQVMREVIRPYTRISLKAISKALNGIPIVDVESLLVGLILDGKAKGRIDQVNGVLIKEVERGVQGGGGGSGGGDDGNGEEGEGNESEEPNSSAGGGNSGRDAVDGAGGAKALSSVPALPTWGKGSVELRTFSAMNDLMGELEKLTLAVTASASRTRRQIY